MPSRRTVLGAATAIVSGLAGCASVPVSRPPRVDSKQITVDEARCVDATRQRTASLSYDSTAHRLSVRGTTVTDAPCTELFLNVDKGVGRPGFENDSMHVIVDSRSVGACEPCPAELSYTATVTFDHDPSTVYVYHTEEVEGRLRPVGPVASETVS